MTNGELKKAQHEVKKRQRAVNEAAAAIELGEALQAGANNLAKWRMGSLVKRNSCRHETMQAV
jgi:hypothetical protein